MNRHDYRKRHHPFPVLPCERINNRGPRIRRDRRRRTRHTTHISCGAASVRLAIDTKESARGARSPFRRVAAGPRDDKVLKRAKRSRRRPRRTVRKPVRRISCRPRTARVTWPHEDESFAIHERGDVFERDAFSSAERRSSRAPDLPFCFRALRAADVFRYSGVHGARVTGRISRAVRHRVVFPKTVPRSCAVNADDVASNGCSVMAAITSQRVCTRRRTENRSRRRIRIRPRAGTRNTLSRALRPRRDVVRRRRTSVLNTVNKPTCKTRVYKS